MDFSNIFLIDATVTENYETPVRMVTPRRVVRMVIANDEWSAKHAFFDEYRCWDRETGGHTGQEWFRDHPHVVEFHSITTPIIAS